MDLLVKPMSLDLYNGNLRVYCRNAVKPPHYVAAGAKISNSLIPEGCDIYGDISQSVLFPGVSVGKGSKITDSVIFPNVRIGRSCIIDKAIISDNAVIEDGCAINDPKKPAADPGKYASEYCTGGISLIASDVRLGKGVRITPNSMVEESVEA
jgi:glucose-1-phosphate adenylyltransferase